jgi:hypothetical protein
MNAPPEPMPAAQRSGDTWAALRAVARHALPRMVEATLIPTVLLYTGLAVTGVLWPGAVAALTWAAGVLVFRMLRGHRVTAILVLAVLGLSIRTLVVMLAGSTFWYFLQPVLTTLAVGALFVASLFTLRPMVARLAHDFCPLTEDITDRPRVKILFRRLTVLWAAVNGVNAVVTFWLLSSLSAQRFIAAKTLSSTVITWSAVAVTVVTAVRVSRHEGLHHSIANGRGLRFAVVAA